MCVGGGGGGSYLYSDETRYSLYTAQGDHPNNTFSLLSSFAYRPPPPPHPSPPPPPHPLVKKKSDTLSLSSLAPYSTTLGDPPEPQFQPNSTTDTATMNVCQTVSVNTFPACFTFSAGVVLSVSHDDMTKRITAEAPEDEMQQPEWPITRQLSGQKAS